MRQWRSPNRSTVRSNVVLRSAWAVEAMVKVMALSVTTTWNGGKREVELAFQANLRWYQAWWRSNGNAPNPPSREELLAMIENAAGDMGAV